MNKKSLYTLFVGFPCLFASCTADNLQKLSFDVALRNDASSIHVGEEVVFDFSGDPDYIVFWSGEDGHKYENRNRTSVQVDELVLSYGVLQRYGRQQTNNILSIKVSEDFSGDYTKEGIAAATWTELSQRDDKEKDWWVPSGDQNPAFAAQGDLSAYKDKLFYIAFQYKTPEKLTEGVQHPRVDITPVSLDKRFDGKTVRAVNPQADMGFRHVRLSDERYIGSGTGVDATTIRFQAANDQTDLARNIEVWCISQPIDASRTATDKGEPIRSLTVPSDSYVHVFTEAGTYTVTFVARNANAWNTEELVREIVIEVLD